MLVGLASENAKKSVSSETKLKRKRKVIYSEKK